MKKIFILFIILFASIAAVASTKDILNLPNFSFLKKTPTVTINKTTFKLYVVNKPQDKEIGLSKYSRLNTDTGMLFVFEKEGYYSFWMKNMKFPIDIIFIDKDHIVTILQNVEPPKNKNENLSVLNSLKPADNVLEINAGLSKKYNFKEGDLVKIEL